MAHFTKTPRKLSGTVLVVLLSLISLVLITLWSFEGGASSEASGIIHSARGAVSTIVMPFDRASSLLGTPLDALGTAASDATAPAETLSELKEQNEELTALVMQLEEYRLENERLSELLNLSTAYNLESTAAHIIRPSIDSWNQAITIDKGAQDGLAVGMPVMSPNGLIGQIESVGPFTSQVRLITDQNSGVAVFLQANRSEGVLTGSLDRLLYLSYIPLDVKVVPGDVVITSGAGGVYPKGIVVGEVTSVTYLPSDVYQTIVVKTIARVKYYEEVLVLTGRQTEVTLSASGTGNTEGSGTSASGSGTASQPSDTDAASGAAQSSSGGEAS